MQTFPALSIAGLGLSTDSEPQLKAVVFYDTIAAGKRGASMLSFLCQNEAGESPSLHLMPWRFDVMHEPMAFKEAIREVHDALIFVISMEGTKELPPSFKTWFAKILDQKKGKDIAIIAVSMGSPNEMVEREVSSIRKVASERSFEVMTAMDGIQRPSTASLGCGYRKEIRPPQPALFGDR